MKGIRLFMVKNKITLKQVISKLDKMDESNKIEWVYSIVMSLNDEFINSLLNELYEKGKSDGAKVEKVKIPDCVANWIKYCKTTNANIVHALILDRIVLYNYARKIDLHKLQEWLKSSENQITFIEAWLNGYEVVKEKHYYVAIPSGLGRYKMLLNFNYLTVSSGDYVSIEEIEKYAKTHNFNITEKMIKESEVSWAWEFAKELEE